MRTITVSVVKEILYQDIKGFSQRKIAASLGISKTTVQKYCNLAKSEGYNALLSNERVEEIALKVHQLVYQPASNREKKALDKISQYHDRISDLLKENYITHKQIHRILSEEGIKFSQRSLNRYIAHYFPKQIKSTVHLKTKAGEEAQVDYAYVGILFNRKIYAFIMTLSHSRYRYVEFVTSQNTKSWIQSHINAFNFFGAVPKSVILDNLKSGVLKPDIYDPTINQSYAELSRHYGFVADPAKVYKPEHKGKVERSVRMVKEQIIAGRRFQNLAELNQYALKWASEINCNETCSSTGRKPIDLFNQEDLPSMLALPSEAFDIPRWTEAKVHLDHHYTVDGNFYSVPTEFIGKTLQIRVGLRTINAYENHKLIKSHIRHYGKGQWITDENDYPKYVAKYLAQDAKYCLEASQKIGDSTFELMKIVLQTETKGAIRKAHAILRLSITYGNERLDNASLRALTFDNYDYKTLKNILEKSLDQKNTKGFSVKLIDQDQTKYAYLGDRSSYLSSMEVHYG